MEHDELFLMYSRYVTFLRKKKSIKVQTSCDFRIKFTRPINFLSIFVWFPRFLRLFLSTFVIPSTNLDLLPYFSRRDGFCLPRRMEFISSVPSISSYRRRRCQNLKFRHIRPDTTRSFRALLAECKEMFQLRGISISFISPRFYLWR